MAIDISRTRPFFTDSFGQVVDRMFEQAFAPFYASTPGNGGTIGVQSLPVNIWETDDAYQAAAMAPGVDEQSINVTVHEDTMAIEGELKFQVPEGAQPIWQEFGPMKFRRSLRLGAAVEPSKVEATYKNGVLFITMPKAEHAKPRQVQVQLGETTGAKTLGSG
jgi:HSP20 family protein